jgi:hypothetical protein
MGPRRATPVKGQRQKRTGVPQKSVTSGERRSPHEGAGRKSAWTHPARMEITGRALYMTVMTSEAIRTIVYRRVADEGDGAATPYPSSAPTLAATL